VSTKNAKDLPLSVNSFQKLLDKKRRLPLKISNLRLTSTKTRSICWESSAYLLMLGRPKAEAACVWHLRCDKPKGPVKKGAKPLDRPRMKSERRAWSRLPLPIPLFVRSRDSKGKDLLEFATALNVSAGGVLVAMHGALRPTTQVSLEIPSAPLPISAPVRKNSRNLRAKVVRVSHGDGYNLVGLKFVQPLLPAATPRPTSTRRKVASSV